MKIIGNGSITKLEKKPRSKCRKWKLRVQTDQGEKTRRFDGTYTQAQEALGVFIGDLCTPASSMTFLMYSAKWIERRELSGDYEDNTLDKDRQQVRLLCGEFGGDLLHEIDKPRAQDGLLAIKNGNNPSKRVLSGTYMNGAHAKMKAIMESACDDGLIPRNPLAKVKAPKIDTQKRRSLPRRDLARFICTMDSIPLDSHTVAARFAVLDGLRRAEIVYVSWRHRSAGMLAIDDSVSESTGAPKGGTKTPSGVRNSPLMPYMEDVLDRWKPIQKAMLAAIGVEQTDDTPICCSATGGYMHPQNLDRWWRQNRSRYGLDGIVLHELRHTYLTMLGATGSSTSVIKSLAGWASSEMADTYVHKDDTADREAVERLSEMLGSEIENVLGSGSDVPPDVPPDVPGRKKEVGNAFRPRIIKVVPLTGFEPAAGTSYMIEEDTL